MEEKLINTIRTDYEEFKSQLESIDNTIKTSKVDSYMKQLLIENRIMFASKIMELEKLIRIIDERC